MDDEAQPLLPLDERFRNAEQYALDLPPPAQPQPPATYVEAQKPPVVCIGNCQICPVCNA